MTQLHQAKDKIQREALNGWYKKGAKGTLQLCTGAGKTRCALMAVEWIFSKKPDARVLIVTPTEYIRDKVFPEEFRKWKLTSLLKKLKVSCIQTEWKTTDQHYDLVIADEIHNYATECYGLFFKNTIDNLLGLSAWIPEDKEEIIDDVAPVVYSLTVDKAVELGVISPYLEYNISLGLTASEIRSFENIQGKYKQLEGRLGGPRFAFANASRIMQMHAGKKKDEVTDDAWTRFQLACAFWKVMQVRKDFLYECPSKVKMVKKLIDKFNIEKTVIFSQSTKFADKIAEGRDDILPYHSKCKDREKNMTAFKDGRTKINHLSTCIAVNEGMDLPKLPCIIIASRTSSPKSHIQRKGRCLRYEEGKEAIVFNIYVADSQDEKWLSKAQETTIQSKIKWVSSLDEIELPDSQNAYQVV